MIKILTSFVFLLITIQAHAESFFVETPNIIGDKSHLQKVVRELITHYIVENGHKVTSTMTDTKMSSSLLQLENSYIMTLRSTINNKSVSKKIKTNTLDDLDVSISRLVKAILKSESVDENINVKEITQNDQERHSKRIKIEKQWMFGLGPSFFPRKMSDNSGVDFLLGYVWTLDYDFDLMVKFEWAKGKNSDGYLGLFSFGGNYFFNNKNHAPYLNLDLGYGSATNKINHSESGWGYALGAGMKFFRTANVNFAVELKYTSILKKIDNSVPSRVAIKFAIFY